VGAEARPSSLDVAAAAAQHGKRLARIDQIQEMDMGSPMRIRATENAGVVDVKVLMSHVMETGQRKDSAGAAIPAHFIQTVSASYNGVPVMEAQWGPAVSKDPFWNFKFKGGKKGDKVSVKWVDNKGDSRTDEAVIS
jgi:sulfur-oxidizing protein SoxZ